MLKMLAQLGTLLESRGLYVPLDKITPVTTSEGRPAVLLWQAFPFLEKTIYTQYGEDPATHSGRVKVSGMILTRCPFRAPQNGPTPECLHSRSTFTATPRSRSTP
jgi:hypothetical protein